MKKSPLYRPEGLALTCSPSVRVQCSANVDGSRLRLPHERRVSTRSRIAASILASKRVAASAGGRGQSSPLLASSRCLTALDLYDNMLGPQGARALAAALSASPALPCLRHLELGSNGIGDDGLMALAGAVSQCRQLESLGMGHNAVADAAPVPRTS